MPEKKNSGATAQKSNKGSNTSGSDQNRKKEDEETFTKDLKVAGNEGDFDGNVDMIEVPEREGEPAEEGEVVASNLADALNKGKIEAAEAEQFFEEGGEGLTGKEKQKISEAVKPKIRSVKSETLPERVRQRQSSKSRKAALASKKRQETARRDKVAAAARNLNQPSKIGSRIRNQAFSGSRDFSPNFRRRNSNFRYGRQNLGAGKTKIRNNKPEPGQSTRQAVNILTGNIQEATNLQIGSAEQGRVPGQEDEIEKIPEEDQLRKNAPDVNFDQFTVNTEQPSGTNVPGTSFVEQDLPTSSGPLQPVDLKVGETALQAENKLENLIGKESAETVSRGLIAPAGVAAEGIFNIPASVDAFAQRPGQSLKASVKGLDRTVRPTVAPVDSAGQIERQAEKSNLIAGALAFPTAAAVGGSSAASNVAGITDDASALQAARQGSGLDFARKKTRDAAGKADNVLKNFGIRPRTGDEFAGRLVGDAGEAPIQEVEDFVSRGSTETRSDPASVMGEEFRPEETDLLSIARGDTARKIGKRREILDPREIEDVDPLTLQTEGGRTEVTPRQTRREALETRVNRFFESDRQDAQFEVQKLNGDSGGLFKERKGSAQIVKQKPQDVDKGDTVDTGRLVDRQDRRQDVADDTARILVEDNPDSVSRPFTDRDVDAGTPTAAGFLGADTGTRGDLGEDRGIGTDPRQQSERKQDRTQRQERKEGQENPLITDKNTDTTTESVAEFESIIDKRNDGENTLLENKDSSNRLDGESENFEDSGDEESIFGIEDDEDSGTDSGFAPTVRATALGLTKEVSAEKAEQLESSGVFTGLGSRNILVVDQSENEDSDLRENFSL